MGKNSRIVCGLICLAGLVAIRLFETDLFYDPFLAFFRGDFSQQQIPAVDVLRWSASTSARFALNTLISLAMLWYWFQDKSKLRMAALVYAAAFILLLGALLVFYFFIPQQKMGIFYVRRFLIHPVLLLLFIPAFYFQDIKQRSQ